MFKEFRNSAATVFMLAGVYLWWLPYQHRKTQAFIEAALWNRLILITRPQLACASNCALSKDTRARAHTHTHTHTHTRTRAHTHSLTHTHTRTRAHMHTCTHTCTHTHTLEQCHSQSQCRFLSPKDSRAKRHWNGQSGPKASFPENVTIIETVLHFKYSNSTHEIAQLFDIFSCNELMHSIHILAFAKGWSNIDLGINCCP